MARPTDLTPKVEERILTAIRAGLKRRQAALAAGIDESTLYKWMKRGKKGEARYVEFFQRVKEADAAGELDLLGLIQVHAVKNWQAAAWVLERTRHGRYAQRQKVQHEVKMTEEQARAKYREITGKDWGEE